MQRLPWFRILLALVMTAWFAAVLPGHTRGMIKVPGAQTTGCGSGGSCGMAEATATEPASTPQRSQPAAPAEDPVRSCAVCFYMTKLEMATVTVWEDRLVARIQSQDVHAPWRLALPLPLAALRGRAPPFLS